MEMGIVTFAAGLWIVLVAIGLLRIMAASMDENVKGLLAGWIIIAVVAAGMFIASPTDGATIGYSAFFIGSGWMILGAAAPWLGERRRMKNLADIQAAGRAKLVKGSQEQVADLKARIADLKARIATNTPFPGKPQEHVAVYPSLIKSFEMQIESINRKAT